MSVVPDQPHTCPKCRQTFPLTVFKRRSRSQNRAPSWCKDCVNSQARTRRLRMRERLANEFLRRIRHGTPPEKFDILFTAVAILSGGVEVVVEKMATRIRSHNISERLRAVRLGMALMFAARHSEITKNSTRRTY